jgi:adenine phosphoribosyltransferase
VSDSFDLDAAIRKVRDFPKPGILFYDVTSILMDPNALSHCLGEMVGRYRDRRISAVAAIESRGFLFAAPLAHELRLPLVLVRKKGKLPGAVYSRTYELEYGTDTIEIQQSDVKTGDNILIVDDLVATGGTLEATAELLSDVGASVEEVFCVIGLPFLGYEKRLAPVHVHTLINYHGE